MLVRLLHLFATLIKNLGFAMLLFQGFTSTKGRESVKNSCMEVLAETKTVSRKLKAAKSHVVLLEDSVVDIELKRISFVYEIIITSQCKEKDK